MKDQTVNYVFDVDGTLTPSRQPIDAEFGKWFLDWTKNKYVFLVSGSDYDKTLEQLGEEICNSVDGVYSCAGNALYFRGELMYTHHFELTEKQRSYLDHLLETSKYPLRTGQHIEERSGMVNFSVIGRGATYDERQDYVEYDRGCNERRTLSKKIRDRFPELESQLGGDTGLDIFPKGKNKGQIAKSIEPFVFFGDKVESGGNDYDIARKAKTMHAVKSWEDTRNILQNLYNY